MHILNRKCLLILIFTCFFVGGYAQSVTSLSPDQLLDKFVNGFSTMSVSNPQTSGPTSVGYFNFENSYSTFPFNSGIIISTGNPNLMFNAVNTTASSIGSGITDTLFAKRFGRDSVYDLAYFSFDFTPETDTIQFEFVLASDEYPAYAYADSLPDRMGIFIQGTNPKTREPYDSSDNRALFRNKAGFETFIGIDQISSNSNPTFFTNAVTTPYGIVYNGFSGSEVGGYFTGYVSVMPVCKSERYTITFVIAELRDSLFDSAILLNEGSFNSKPRDIEPLTVSLASDTIICPELQEVAILKAKASEGWGYYQYHWSEDSDSSLYDTTFVISSIETTTTYTVTVTDICDNEAESNVVTVTVQCPVVIPNVFTPNGDKINDTFEVEKIDEYTNVTMVIYNRWGRKVYESTHYENPDNWWDGGNHPDGTYYYILEFMVEGVKKRAKGVITKISK